MRVVFTVLYLTVGLNSFPVSSRSCARDPKSFTMEEIENIIYGLAKEKGVPSTVILNRLLRKTRVKQRLDKARQRNQLQEIALQELINSESIPRSPQISIDTGGRTKPGLLPKIKPPLPPPTEYGRNPMITEALYPGPISIPRLPDMPQRETNNMFTGMLLPPGFPVQLPSSVPQSIFIPFTNLGPPANSGHTTIIHDLADLRNKPYTVSFTMPGVTIRVKAGVDNIPEVTVTLSPMMTIVEALKQAESKFRSVLGLPLASDDDVILFSHSPFAECYVIRRFDSIESTENGFWKIIVSDISGKVIYDSVCLPSRNEVAVKPGMTITLLYTVL